MKTRGHAAYFTAKIGLDRDDVAIVAKRDKLILDRISGGTHYGLERLGQACTLSVQIAANLREFGGCGIVDLTTGKKLSRDVIYGS